MILDDAMRNQTSDNNNNNKYTLSTMTDRDKYLATNYSFFCDANVSSIMGATNHKTGTYLFQHIIMYNIFNYYKQKCVYKNHKNANNKIRYRIDQNLRCPSLYNDNGHASQSTINSFLRRSLKSNHNSNDSNSGHIVILNLIRDPVETVLSGYNYHRDCKESWTWALPINITRINHLCGNVIPYIESIDNRFVSYTLSKLYKSIANLSIGIDIEYYRFIQCEYPRIVTSYEIMKKFEIKYLNQTRMHLKNIRLEDFQINFNATLNTIFDVLGIYSDNNENRSILLDAFQESDLYHHNVTKGKQVEHITKGTYNKTQQINALLINKERCESLKNYTMTLDYVWKHNDYC